MHEMLPGVHHWTSPHEKIGQPVHSYFLEDVDGGVLVDPREPDEGLEWFRERRQPHDVLLTNRHHYRHSDRFAHEFGSIVRCHRAGLHEFTKEQEVLPFEHGEALPNGYLALEVDALCPEETAFHTVREGGILFLGDSVIRWDGELAFVPDKYMGDDSEAVKRGLRAALTRILEEREFRHLCLAHGEPILEEGSERLRAFVEAGKERPASS